MEELRPPAVSVDELSQVIFIKIEYKILSLPPSYPSKSREHVTIFAPSQFRFRNKITSTAAAREADK